MIVVSLLLAIPIVALLALFTSDASAGHPSQMSFWLGSIPALLSYMFVSGLSFALLNRSSKASPDTGNTTASAKKPAKKRAGAEQGSVKWFNSSKGYGFITRDKGDDVFVHYRSISGKGHRSLYEGQVVEFTVSNGHKGLQADDVVIISGEPKRSKRRKSA